MPLIEFKNISVKFEDKEIINNICFVINKGEKVALKGRSGSGKSTLLYNLMGFRIPDSGQIYFDNSELNKGSIESVRRQMCWLPQNVNILGRGLVETIVLHPFTFLENKKNKPSKSEIHRVFSLLNLGEEILDSLFENLSGGEMQRVGLAICLLLKKDLLILDEPSSALDRDSIRNVIELVLKNEKLTVLSASHDEEWIEYCDKVIEL
jgi:putative ABC transport system ATP-binding protein